MLVWPLELAKEDFLEASSNSHLSAACKYNLHSDPAFCSEWLLYGQRLQQLEHEAKVRNGPSLLAVASTTCEMLRPIYWRQ
jgi:hypothetical protein